MSRVSAFATLYAVTIAAAAIEYVAVVWLLRFSPGVLRRRALVALAGYLGLLFLRFPSLVASNASVLAVSAVGGVLFGAGLTDRNSLV